MSLPTIVGFLDQNYRYKSINYPNTSILVWNRYILPAIEPGTAACKAVTVSLRPGSGCTQSVSEIILQTFSGCRGDNEYSFDNEPLSGNVPGNNYNLIQIDKGDFLKGRL